MVAKETETGTQPKVNVNQSVCYKKSHLPQGLKMKNSGQPFVKWTLMKVNVITVLELERAIPYFLRYKTRGY